MLIMSKSFGDHAMVKQELAFISDVRDVEDNSKVGKAVSHVGSSHWRKVWSHSVAGHWINADGHI